MLRKTYAKDSPFSLITVLSFCLDGIFNLLSLFLNHFKFAFTVRHSF